MKRNLVLISICILLATISFPAAARTLSVYDANNNLLNAWRYDAEASNSDICFPDDIEVIFVYDDSYVGVVMKEPLSNERKNEIEKLSGAPQHIRFVGMDALKTNTYAIDSHISFTSFEKCGFYQTGGAVTKEKATVFVPSYYYDIAASYLKKNYPSSLVEIKIQNGYITTPGAKPDSPPLPPYASLNTDCSIYRAPGGNYMKIGALKKGAVVNIDISYTSPEWTKIVFQNKDAYIKTEHLTMNDMTVIDAPSTDAGSIGSGTAKTAVHVRSGAGKRFPKLGQLTRGQIVAIWSIRENWAEITWKTSSENAYVSMEYLQIKDIEKQATTSANVNLRAGAGTKYKKAGALSKGQSVTVCEIDGLWAKVKLNGLDAYVNIKYLKF